MKPQSLASFPRFSQQQEWKFGARHALLYNSTLGSAAENQVPGMSLQDCDSDSEIGDEPESCFEDFKLGFDIFHYSTLPSTTSASSKKRKNQKVN